MGQAWRLKTRQPDVPQLFVSHCSPVHEQEYRLVSTSINCQSVVEVEVLVIKWKGVLTAICDRPPRRAERCQLGLRVRMSRFDNNQLIYAHMETQMIHDHFIWLEHITVNNKVEQRTIRNKDLYSPLVRIFGSRSHDVVFTLLEYTRL
jgi:hypothetical protein